MNVIILAFINWFAYCVVSIYVYVIIIIQRTQIRNNPRPGHKDCEFVICGLTFIILHEYVKVFRYNTIYTDSHS